MDPFLQFAKEKYPLAAADGRIHGQGGKFALLCCGGPLTRHMYLFETQEQCNKRLWKWDTSGCGADCTGDHKLWTLKLPVVAA